jgi:hypothetical protein
MKKSNKKIPKTHLPKYLYGDEVPMNQQSSYNPNVNPMYRTNDSGMGPNGQADAYRAPSATSEGTQNIYNQGRAKSNMLGTNQKLTGNQYAQMGQAVAQGGMQAYQTSQTPGLSEYEKNQQYGKSIKSAETGVVSAVNPIFGVIHSGVTAATGPLSAKATETDEQGKLKNKNFAKADIIGQGFADPMAMIPTMISNKFSMKKYINSVEDNAKGKIEAQKAQEDAYAQQQTDYRNQQQSMMDAAFARGYANQNQTGGNTYVQYAKYGGQMKYAMGGMNKYPGGGMGEGNGQVELDENSIAPNGQFTQFNELDHNQQDPNQPNASLAPGEKIFSAKLKPMGSKKSFADLNKSNNTNREDKLFSKGNLDPKSEVSLKLTMMAKMKNSDVLFAMQEQLKKDKVAAYAKKMGVELPPMDNEQMELQGKMAMGGVQLPYYNTDNAGNPIYAMGGGYPAMTNPYNNFRGSIPMYPDGGVNAQGLTKPQYEQAQTDSMTLYKSGFGKVPNYKFPGFNDAQGRLTEISGIGTGETTIPRSLQGGTGTISQGSNDYSGIEQYQKPLGLPWKEYIPATEKSGVAIESKPLEKPVSSPNWGSTTILKDGRHLRAYPDGHTEIVGNPRKVVNVGNLEKKKYGGKMPKYVDGGPYIDPSETDMQEQADRNAYYDSLNRRTNNTNVNQNSLNLAPNTWNWNAPVTAPTVNQANTQRVIPTNETGVVNLNRSSLRVTDPNDKNFDWGKLALNAGNFAGQNMGNIYDLSRKNAPLQKYDRATAKYMDPTKAIAGENYIYRQTKNTLPGLTGGNAGATMALLFANKANTATRIGRLRETYDNANAQIGNQTNQFNTEIAYREAEARAKDAAMKENVRSQAIHSIGSNFGKMTKSGKQDNMDQDTLKMFQWRYKNEPGFKKYIDNFSTQNNSEEATV